jgi:dolichyl-phosphate beta-glucosyltransferase
VSASPGQPYLSLVIPAYNEARRLGTTLRAVLSFLRGHAFDSELVLVDDGSSDGTAELATRLLAETPPARNVDARVLTYRPNAGKGHAVRTGVVATRGRFVAFADADLATPLDQINRALPYLDPPDGQPRAYDLVVGSRAVAGARIERYQPLYRRLSARLFNAIRDTLVPVSGVTDSQCGFKLFEGDLARAIFARQRVDGFMFDVETLFIAQRLGLRVLELGVPWADAGESKVRFSSGFRIVPDLLRARGLHGRLTPADRAGLVRPS